MYKRANRRLPDAVAMMNGVGVHAGVQGEVQFYQRQGEVMVQASFQGLPQGHDACTHPIFGFHIHSGTACTGNATDPFADAGLHYNPSRCPHPYHAGDLPPIFGVQGKAYTAFLTDRFSVKDVLGNTMILHDRPDDFTTQPGGNSGAKIACGIIRSVKR